MIGQQSSELFTTSCSGTQSRTVTCTRSDNVPVAGTLCLVGSKPSEQQSCTKEGCTYEWRYGDWSPCPACGSANQTRSEMCYIKGSPNTVFRSYCDGLPRQPTSRSCNIPPCPSPPSYRWQEYVWGPCDKTCGGGTRTRTQPSRCVIVNDPNLVAQAESNCNGLVKPPDSQPCNTHACQDEGMVVESITYHEGQDFLRIFGPLPANPMAYNGYMVEILGVRVGPVNAITAGNQIYYQMTYGQGINLIQTLNRTCGVPTFMTKCSNNWNIHNLSATGGPILYLFLNAGGLQLKFQR
jgi:hypothetical protein